MIKTHAIAAFVGLLIGLTLMWYVQSGRIDAANARTDLERQKVATIQADLAGCSAATAVQNQAIEDLRKKADAAQAALDAARAEREQADKSADAILQERTPEGADACQAARDAFSSELQKERTK